MIEPTPIKFIEREAARDRWHRRRENVSLVFWALFLAAILGVALWFFSLALAK